MANGRVANEEVGIGTALLLLWIARLLAGSFDFVEAPCVPPGGCNVALAYYTFNGTTDGNLSSVAARFQASEKDIRSYSHLNSSTSVESGQALLIPFSCQCSDNELGHNFSYSVVQGDQADTIASQKFEFLTTVSAMTSANGATSLDAIYPENILKIPVNCSCGDPSVSSQYGLFATYVALANDNLEGLAKKFNISGDTLQSYNPGVSLNLLQSSVDILFVPERDGSGVYPPFNTTGLGNSKSNNKVVGASVGAAILLLACIAGGVLFYVYIYVPRRRRKISSMDKYQSPHVAQSLMDTPGAIRPHSEESALSNITAGTQTTSSISNFADRSVEFSYEELAACTDNFSIAKKIGQGGYGSVFYGELRGQKLAIKVMNLLATKEFMAELNVLMRVHHTNLVRLVGYCTVESLFLVYEYVDNGTLSQHLRASERAGSTPLPWTTRINIALDSARGLEYIHEHTTPTYIHRDIKSSNILIDKNFHAKVADFGLTKLTESGGMSHTLPSRLVGTFGYMAPEYARLGDVSAKADVYSFGVVLFEIISAKEAIVHLPDTTPTAMTKGNSQGLVKLFENILNDPDGKAKLRTLVDPALGDDYPLESVWKMANLAGACTREEPMLRPTMRVAVVALMTLSSSTQEWESDYGMEGLISGR